jgi:GNAT superfamily N-acetyltransferase
MLAHMLIRAAVDGDRAFVVEMARLACSLEGRHAVPLAGEPEVAALLPGPADVTLVVVNEAGARLGAAWCHTHAPPLLLGEDGRPVPEVVLAVCPPSRGRGIGTALLDALADTARPAAAALCLNVHLLNPSVRLYIRTGFRVAGQGRGWYGVAMLRTLDQRM